MGLSKDLKGEGVRLGAMLEDIGREGVGDVGDEGTAVWSYDPYAGSTSPRLVLWKNLSW